MAYSRDEMIAIMTMFYRSGMNKAQAGRMPGYPSRHTLAAWEKMVESGELPVKRPERPPHRRHKRVPDDVKRKALSLLDAGLGPSSVAEMLGTTPECVIRWRRRARDGTLFAKSSGEPAEGPGKAGGTVAKGRGKRGYDDPYLENQVLRAVLADLKAGGSLDPLISNRRKVELGERLRREFGFPLRAITSSLRISRSTYEYHRRRIGRDKYADLRPEVRAAFEELEGRFGYRAVHARLRERGRRVSEKVVRRIMREEGLQVRYLHKPRKSWSSYLGEVSPAPPNIVGRNFRTGLPNFLWLTDITQMNLPGFKCYMSPVVDCFDGMVVACRLSLHPDAELVNSMLRDACSTLRGDERTVIHDDRGAHYRWPGWVAICKEHGLTRSMSAKGCCPDNSAMEGFFGRFKQEFFYHRSWTGITFEEFEREVLGYVRWYNEERPKRSLGWMSPCQYRRSLGLA